MRGIPRIALDTILRERLPEFEREIRVRQVVDLARQTPLHALGNLGNGALLAGIFWSRLPHAAIAGWLGLFTIIMGIGLVRWQRKRRWPPPKEVSRRAIRRTTAWAFFCGVMWAAALVFAFPQDDMPRQLLILFLAGGLGAAAVATMASQPIACICYLGPPIVSVLALLAIQTRSEVAPVMAAMGTLYLVALVIALFNGFSSFVTVVRGRIDSRALETKLLETELAAASAANRAKSMFLAKMSHELRTPLNAIIGFSELIRDASPGRTEAGQYREYAADIHAAGQHLLRIVNDVLDISTIEAGRLKLHEEQVRIDALVTSALKLMSPAARDAEVTLTADLPPDLPALWADEQRVRQLLLNLLSNAVKFSRPPGQAKVAAAVRPDGVAITVSDNGIGMTATEIARVREPFHQVQDSLSRKHEGVGLGLALADRFMALHGGRLEIASEPGVGTTVTTIFPTDRIAAPSEQFVEMGRKSG